MNRTKYGRRNWKPNKIRIRIKWNKLTVDSTTTLLIMMIIVHAYVLLILKVHIIPIRNNALGSDNIWITEWRVQRCVDWWIMRGYDGSGQEAEPQCVNAAFVSSEKCSKRVLTGVASGLDDICCFNELLIPGKVLWTGQRANRDHLDCVYCSLWCSLSDRAATLTRSMSGCSRNTRQVVFFVFFFAKHSQET